MDVNKELSRFVGIPARLWRFTASHDRLTINLYNDKTCDELFIFLTYCETISVPVMWKFRLPVIEKIDEYHSKFIDVENGINIEFGWLTLSDKDMCRIGNENSD